MSKIHWSKSAAIVVGTSLALWGLTYCAVANAQGIRQDSASAAQAIAIAGGGSGSGSGAAQRTQRLVTVPGVAPPSFYGANPCSNSASGGVAVMGFGTSAGAQWTERECRDQEWFRFFHMAGQGSVATAYVCRRYPDIAQAYADAGVQCPSNRAVAASPAPSPVLASQTPPVAPSVARPARPAYCRPGIANSECQ